MAEKKNIDLLDNFNFFNITFRFQDEEMKETIKETLSKLSLLKFDKIKFDYNIEKLTIIEELFPEFGFTPSITFEFKDFEVFLSKKKIAVSYPKGLSKGKKIIFRGEGKFKAIPYFRERMDEKKERITLDDLDEIDLFLKIALFLDILEQKKPLIKEISTIFEVKLDEKLNTTNLAQIIEQKFLKNKRIMFDDLDFEISEGKDRYFFSMSSQKERIMCSFIYGGYKFSLFENKIQDLLIKSFNKYKEIKEELKL